MTIYLKLHGPFNLIKEMIPLTIYLTLHGPFKIIPNKSWLNLNKVSKNGTDQTPNKTPWTKYLRVDVNTKQISGEFEQSKPKMQVPNI